MGHRPDASVTTIRAELRQRLIDKGIKAKRADELLRLADRVREGK